MHKLLTRLAMEAKTRAHATRSYVDFEPPCDWRKTDRSETLVLYLPEFKKEELKVHITNMKTLKISGERQKDERKRSRFCKKITVPSDCNAKEIHAKFVDGLLEIKMPKKNSFTGLKQEQSENIEQTRELAKEKLESEITQDQFNGVPNPLNENKTGKPSNATKLAPKKDNSQLVSRLKSFCKMAMKVAVGMAMVVGFGAIIVYSWFCLLA